MRFLYPFLSLFFISFVVSAPVNVLSDQTEASDLDGLYKRLYDENLYSSGMSKRDNVALTTLLTALNKSGQGVALLKIATTSSVLQPSINQGIVDFLESTNLTTILDAAVKKGLALDIVLYFLTHYDATTGLIRIVKGVLNTSSSNSSSGFISTIIGTIFGSGSSGGIVSSLISDIFGSSSSSSSSSSNSTSSSSSGGLLSGLLDDIFGGSSGSTTATTGTATATTGTSTSTSTSGNLIGDILGDIFGGNTQTTTSATATTGTSTSTSTSGNLIGDILGGIFGGNTKTTTSATATTGATTATAATTGTATTTSSSGNLIGDILGNIFGTSKTTTATTATTSAVVNTATTGATTGPATIAATTTTAAAAATTTTAAAATTTAASDPISSIIGGIGNLIGSILKRDEEGSFTEIEKRDVVDAVFQQIVKLIATDNNIYDTVDSLTKSGLAVSVVDLILTDTKETDFAVTLVRKIIDDKAITLSSLLTAVEGSNLIWSIVGSIIGNHSYLELVFQYVIALFTGKITLNL